MNSHQMLASKKLASLSKPHKTSSVETAIQLGKILDLNITREKANSSGFTKRSEKSNS